MIDHGRSARLTRFSPATMSIPAFDKTVFNKTAFNKTTIRCGWTRLSRISGFCTVRMRRYGAVVLAALLLFTSSAFLLLALVSARVDPNDPTVAEGNWVMGRSVVTATHTTEALEVKPTHKRIETTFWDLHLFDGEGLILETWNLMDSVAIMSQLGLLPEAK